MSHQDDVRAFIKADADRLGLGLREYCRRFGITYTSLRGYDLDPDVAEREATYDALDVIDNGEDRLERQMLGGWDDSAYTDHLAMLRAKKEAGGT
jgi:hypothetical protein